MRQLHKRFVNTGSTPLELLPIKRACCCAEKHARTPLLLLSVVAAAVGILIAAMLTFATNNAPVAITQAEQLYPPEPLALPANPIIGTLEQCTALPDPQQPESTECVRKRGKEYAERLGQWLKEPVSGRV